MSELQLRPSRSADRSADRSAAEAYRRMIEAVRDDVEGFLLSEPPSAIDAEVNSGPIRGKFRSNYK
jgi:hypothetical protein